MNINVQERDGEGFCLNLPSSAERAHAKECYKVMSKYAAPPAVPGQPGFVHWMHSLVVRLTSQRGSESASLCQVVQFLCLVLLRGCAKGEKEQVITIRKKQTKPATAPG